ncbi:MAG: high-affinity branched-chain amino acid ABC transporter ATP-binding protein LivG, partial [Clostridiales bacterium]|nr:high-affinity branched-chain amino acid ABC transporter ATP-binding protein LivG [Clostridiales bacterium]NLT14449.1 high-affinity branched-chain amino acid ABC transporter ATP-binding protein LivG [Clostridiales bacterium]
MPMLEATGVSKAFGGLKAVSNVDIHVNEGEILGLIGPNGAG